MISNKKFILPFAVCILMHLFFYQAAFRNGHTVNADSEEYLLQSLNIRDHHTFYCGNLNRPVEPALYSQRPPGFGFFLMIMNGYHNREFILLIQHLLGILTSVIVLLCISRIFPHVRSWVTAIPFLFIWPSYISASMIMAETLFTFLVTAAVAIPILIPDNKYSSWYSMLLLTMAMLVKPIVWLMPVVLLLAGVLYCIFKKHSFRILLPLLTPLVVIIMMFARNYKLTAVAEYSSVSRKLLLNYNLPSLLNAVKGQEASRIEIASIQQHASMLGYRSRTMYIDDQVMKYILHHPFQYLLLHVKGAINFFLDTGRWELNYLLNGSGTPRNWKSMSEAESFGQYLEQYHWSQLTWYSLTLIFNIAICMAWLAFTFNRRIALSTRLIIVFTVLWFAALTGPSASARFRVPVEPLLLITWPALFMTSRMAQSAKRSAVTFAA